MLTPDEASAILKKHEIDSMKVEQRQLDAIALLPEDLRQTA